MMILLVLALVLIGVMIGGVGMRRMGQMSRRVIGPWRPGVGVGALICLFGAAALAVRGAVIEAAVLAVAGVVLAAGARRWSPPISKPSGPSPSRMALEEARRILGVDATAEPETIEAAYRRLMQRAHPDLGGTSGLAAQLNAARDALLKPR